MWEAEFFKFLSNMDFQMQCDQLEIPTMISVRNLVKKTYALKQKEKEKCIYFCPLFLECHHGQACVMLV